MSGKQKLPGALAFRYPIMQMELLGHDMVSATRHTVQGLTLLPSW